MESENRKKRFSGHGCCLGVIALMLLALLALTALIFVALFIPDFASDSDELSAEDGKTFSDKIAVIEVNGVIMSGDVSEYSSVCSSDWIIKSLEKAAKDKKIRAIILSLNTPGGEVTAADDVYSTILRIRKKTGKPVIALMNSIAASGGFYIAMGCSKVLASRLTMTGSIGVIISTYNCKGLLDWFGIEHEVYKSGEMKDLLNPARKRTDKEITLLQNMVRETYVEFVKIVADGRKKPVKSILDKPLADGRVFSGAEALKLGMIDGLGRMPEAVSLAEKTAKVPQGSLKLVYFRRNRSLYQLLLGSRSSAQPVRIELMRMAPFADMPPLRRGVIYLLPPGWF